MPVFQFPVVVTIATSALLSLVLYGLSTSKLGRIALPVTSDSPLESRHDPFDVTSPEDIIDGEPIDEEKFWANVRSFIVVRICIAQHLSFLDEATRGTARNYFCGHHLSPDCHSGICSFVWDFNYHSDVLAACLVCCLPLGSRGPVCWHKHGSLACKEHHSPLRPHNPSLCAIGVHSPLPP